MVRVPLKGYPVTTPPRSAPPRSAAPRSALLRKLPFLLILGAAAIGAFSLRDVLSFEALAAHRETLLGWRDTHFVATAAGFMLAYAVIVALSLPGATVATLTGGFLFGLFPGVLFNVTAATAGAVAIFLAARSGFGDSLARRATESGGQVARLQAALRENELEMLFLMRLVPFVPFVLANLIPAFIGVRPGRFAFTTFFGIIPGALVFTSVGAGLSEVFARGARPDLSIIFAPHVLGPILGLAVLAALPVVIRRYRRLP